jgi:hypothetical protein
MIKEKNKDKMLWKKKKKGEKEPKMLFGVETPEDVKKKYEDEETNLNEEKTFTI